MEYVYIVAETCDDAVFFRQATHDEIEIHVTKKQYHTQKCQNSGSCWLTDTIVGVASHGKLCSCTILVQTSQFTLFSATLVMSSHRTPTATGTYFIRVMFVMMTVRIFTESGTLALGGVGDAATGPYDPRGLTVRANGRDALRQCPPKAGRPYIQSDLAKAHAAFELFSYSLILFRS